MACRLFGAKTLSEPVLCYCQLDPKEQPSVKFNQNTKLFILKNASDNIACEKAAILSKGRWVNWQDQAIQKLYAVVEVDKHTNICI